MSPPTANLIAITGSSGLVGRAVCARLRSSGKGVRKLVRRSPRSEDEVSWDPQGGQLDADVLSGVQAVIHLAGAGVSDRRWSESFKSEIRESRVRGTQTLASAIRAAKRPPLVLVSSSGVGFYGDTGGTWVEEVAPGAGTFLASVCEAWEGEARKVGEHTRSVQLRTGMVLSPDGGALKKMLTPFRMGLGGRLGSGRQYISWITLHDMVRVIEHAIHSQLMGPVNAVGPNPVTNAEFAKTLARVLGRPAIFPVPETALRMVLGELAGEVIAGQRARPAKLLADGFRFEHARLEEALRSLLGQ